MTESELHQKVDRIAEAVVRIDERTERMDRESDLRFASVHKRIDDVRHEARQLGGKAGAATGSALGVAVSVCLHYLKTIVGQS
jgi:hypothetical protein